MKDMKTPICDFVRDYGSKEPLRLHVPGHKGNPVLGAEHLDVTEVKGADVLYHAEGIIRESEENAASLFGTRRTLYSAEGSSLPIRAMLYLTALYARSKGRRGRLSVMAARNVHKSFLYAAAMLDLDVVWLYPEETDNMLSCPISPRVLENALTAATEKPVAVYVTSPDYLGTVADVAALSAVCEKYGVLLLVDNAHGAYLRFLKESRHPMDLGAHLCCDSAHKTLPVLTGGAYLHISNRAPDFFADHAEEALAVFASTSPSYLILQSLDLANRFLAEGYRERLAAFSEAAEALKERLAGIGYEFVGDEPLKITVAPKSRGYTGDELSALLEEQGIICEFSDPDFTVMMVTPEIAAAGLSRLETALLAIPRKTPIPERPPVPDRPERVLSLREALFSPQERVQVPESEGKILCDAGIACPPAVSPAVPGERIDASLIRCLTYYGVKNCLVLSE